MEKVLIIKKNGRTIKRVKGDEEILTNAFERFQKAYPSKQVENFSYELKENKKKENKK